MAEEMNPNSMGERPPVQNPVRQLPPEAQQRLMQPSQEIGAVLLARISLMSPEELQTLDEAINPKTARVLMKLLPELEQIINQVGGQSQQRQAPAKMGALGGVR
jgi:hypothetical protein|tara:strand:- start:509 stop:820 length:312 start_codon:yes stop_codon:yes gene_type:complete